MGATTYLAGSASDAATPYPFNYGKPYCGDPINQQPINICDMKTNLGDVNGISSYSVKVDGSVVSASNYNAVSNVTVLNNDTPMTFTNTQNPTVFNVLLN